MSFVLHASACCKVANSIPFSFSPTSTNASEIHSFKTQCSRNVSNGFKASVLFAYTLIVMRKVLFCRKCLPENCIRCSQNKCCQHVDSVSDFNDINVRRVVQHNIFVVINFLTSFLTRDSIQAIARRPSVCPSVTRVD